MATQDTCCSIVPYFTIHDGKLKAVKALCEQFIRFEAEDAGRQPGVESLPSRRLGRRSRAGFLLC